MKNIPEPAEAGSLGGVILWPVTSALRALSSSGQRSGSPKAYGLRIGISSVCRGFYGLQCAIDRLI